MRNWLQGVEWSNQKFVDPGLQVYSLATPLTEPGALTVWERGRSKRRRTANSLPLISHMINR